MLVAKPKSPAQTALDLGFQLVPLNDEGLPSMKWAGGGLRKLSGFAHLVGSNYAVIVGDGDFWALDIDEPKTVALPPYRTLTVRTGGGGLHVYFRHNAYSRQKLSRTFTVPGRKRTLALECFVSPKLLTWAGSAHRTTARLYVIETPGPVACASRALVDALVKLAPAPRRRQPAAEGLWSLEAVQAALDASSIEYRPLSAEKLAVLCPFCDSETLSTKTAVWVFNGYAVFHCFAPDCGGKKWRDYSEAIGSAFNLYRWIEREAYAKAL